MLYTILQTIGNTLYICICYILSSTCYILDAVYYILYAECYILCLICCILCAIYYPPGTTIYYNSSKIYTIYYILFSSIYFVLRTI